MTIEIAALAAAQPSGGLAPIGADFASHSPLPTPAAHQDFQSMVTDGLKGINGDLMTTQGDLQQLAVGDVQNLHQVMIHLEENRLSFQVFMQVRNRLLEAYQDVMKMQV